MNDDFITGLPDGSIPTPPDEEVIQEWACDEDPTLTVTFLYRNQETDRIVVRFDLDSPYWADEHEAANGSWSLALPRYEVLCFISAILGKGNLKVKVRREELLA